MSSTEVVSNATVTEKRARPSRKAAENASNAMKELAKKPVTTAKKSSNNGEPKAKRGRPAKDKTDSNEKKQAAVALTKIKKPSTATGKSRGRPKKTEQIESTEEASAEE